MNLFLAIIADVYPHNTAALTNHIQEVFQKLIPRMSMDIVIFFSAVAKHQPEVHLIKLYSKTLTYCFNLIGKI